MDKLIYFIKKCNGFLILFLIWYLLSLYVGAQMLPYPHEVIHAFFELLPKGLDVHILASLKRLMIGLILSIVLGMHIGLFLGLFKLGNMMVMPFINAIYPIPKAALLPLFIILFGIGDLTKILLIVVIVIFPIIMNTKSAILQIPKENFYVAGTLGLSKWDFYKNILIPAILPNLLVSIRIGIGTSIAVLFLSETFATFEGLGYYINLYIAQNSLKMFTAIFALSLIGSFLFLIVDLLERWFCRWL
jgi:NitT/TauT family transport system permease protein